MTEIKDLPCAVCEWIVNVDVEAQGSEPVLCIVHFFADDPTADWEADE